MFTKGFTVCLVAFAVIMVVLAAVATAEWLSGDMLRIGALAPLSIYREY